MGDEGLKKVFAAFDTDGSGEISIEELSAALEKGGKSIEPDELMDIVLKIDKDSNGQISFDEFKEIFALAPDALPPGVKQVVDVSNAFLGTLGYVASTVVSPITSLLAAPVVMPSYVFEEETSWIIKEKMFSFGASQIKNGAGEDIFEVPYKALSVKSEMRLIDMKTQKELLNVEQHVMTMSHTFYVMKDDEVLLTMRKKMLSLEGFIFVYEGKAEFDWGNNTTAKKLFTMKGFSLKKWFGCTFEDNLTGKDCATTKETVIALTDTYTLVVQPGYDVTLMLAMMLCVDKIKEQGG